MTWQPIETAPLETVVKVKCDGIEHIAIYDEGQWRDEDGVLFPEYWQPVSDMHVFVRDSLSEWQRGYTDCDNDQDEDPTGCKMYKDGYRKRLKELDDENVRVG